jgi:hypothetical protein
VRRKAPFLNFCDFFADACFVCCDDEEQEEIDILRLITFRYISVKLIKVMIVP